jgi:hypothetical protein
MKGVYVPSKHPGEFKTKVIKENGSCNFLEIVRNITAVFSTHASENYISQILIYLRKE